MHTCLHPDKEYDRGRWKRKIRKWVSVQVIQSSLPADQALPSYIIQGSGDITPYILNLNITWRQVVNFTPRQLCP